GKPQTVKLTLARSTTGAKGGTGWGVDRPQAGRDHAAVYTFDKPVGFLGGTVLTFRLSFPADPPAARQTLGRLRLSVAAGDVPADFDAPELAHNECAAAVKSLVSSGGKEDVCHGLLASRADPAEPNTACKQAVAQTQVDPAVVALYCCTDRDWLKLDAAVRRSWADRPRPTADVAFVATEGVPPYRMMIQGPDL